MKVELQICENWNYYTNWLKQKLPQYHKWLRDGASSDDITELEKYLAIKLPAQFKILYGINDGETEENNGLGAFLGFKFLSINKIIEVQKKWMAYDQDDYGSSYPEKTIKVQYINPKWIPLFEDSGGNYIGIDMDPDSKGSDGQIINFGRDESHKFLIAKDLDEFLSYVRNQINNGTCDKAIVQEDDGGYSYGLTPQSHLIDDLREVFGKKRVHLKLDL
jgi:internalin A